MYLVTAEFQNKIKENNRTFKVMVQIQHSTGVLDLTDKDIIGGSIVFNESSQAGEEFTIGDTVASTFDIKLVNKPEYATINFEGATIIPQIGLLLRENIDTENYFLSAPQPTEFQEGVGEEIWEYVPLGRFNIDDARKLRNSIEIKAIDNMINLDIPYSLSSLSYPATLYQIYVNICNVADITVGTLDFPNKDYVVNERPQGDYTLRDMLSYTAELAGCFAKINRNGAGVISWYKESGITLGPSNRFNFNPREDLIQIKGVKFETEDTAYLAGTDEYVVDLSENPLLQDNYNIVLPNVFNNIKDTIFTPFESNWQGNPAMEAGDMITQTDRDGNIFNTIVTNNIYKYRGAGSISGKGLPLKAMGYKGSTNKKITNIVRQEIRPIGDKLTTLEQAQLDATELIANMLGGYAFYEADAFYVADNPILANAMKIWKWGIGGFGYSSTGKDGVYTTAITADGSIVAELVAAGIITANMVQTGILQSTDGSTWINLDNGEFNFKDVLKWENNQLVFSQPELFGNIRYIRCWVKDTLIDGGSRGYSSFAELQVYEDGVNIALNKSITTNFTGSYFHGTPSVYTDGDIESYVLITDISEWYYMQVDLGQVYNNVDKIINYLSPFENVEYTVNNKLEVSEDGVNWITLFDSEIEGTYIETVGGKTYSRFAADETVDLTYLENDIADIKNLVPGTLKGGITSITNQRVRVEHGSTSQYSEIRADGFVRKWPNGEAKYVNDIWMGDFQNDGGTAPSSTQPSDVTVILPLSMKDRTDLKVILTLGGNRMQLTTSQFGTAYWDSIILSCTDTDQFFNAATPYIIVRAYRRFSGSVIKYKEIDFQVIVVGGN